MYVQEATSSITNTASTKSSTMVSKDDFLKILMSQLKYQDPLEPMKPDQFLSQLSQLTQVEELQNIAKSLEDLKAATEKADSSQWLSALGKKMNVNDNTLSEGDELMLSPSTSFDEITLTLKNPDGTTKEVKFKQGDQLVYKNESGGTMTATGVSATKNGESVDVMMSLFRVIKGMQLGDSGPMMVAGDGKAYPLSSVAQIKE